MGLLRENKEFSGMSALPWGKADRKITEGCVVLEGGAFRGLYSAGVLDALMEAGINLRCTVGVSAGAMNGISYVSGQIGRSARINLKYRHDKRYIGVKALKSNRGIIGFDFVLHGLKDKEALDMERFSASDRRFVAVATDCQTGQAAYLEKGRCTDIFQAVRASASMPYCSDVVWLEGIPYLDGGCSDSIPYDWAIKQKYEKIIVVRTRTKNYRKKIKANRPKWSGMALYHSYPAFKAVLDRRNEKYNSQCEELLLLERTGKVFVISPSQDLGVTRLEGDMEKLGKLYYLGYHDAKNQIDEICRYLDIKH